MSHYNLNIKGGEPNVEKIKQKDTVKTIPEVPIIKRLYEKKEKRKKEKTAEVPF